MSDSYDPSYADASSLFGSWDPNTTSGNVTNPSIANASTGGIIAANNTTGSGGLGNFFGGLLDFATPAAPISAQVASAQHAKNQNTGVAGPPIVKQTAPASMAAWLPYAIGGAVLLLLAVVFLKKKKG